MDQNLFVLQDELTLHFIASGLLALAQSSERGNPISLPYPRALQRGLDRLVVAALLRNVQPPRSVPDMIAWCQRPLIEWPLSLPDHFLEPGDTLLDGPIITDICTDWARTAADIEAELTEERFMAEVFSICKAANAPESYIAFRRLLIERPVLTALELQQQCLESHLQRMGYLIRRAYRPVSSSYVASGQEIHCCGYCGNLLLPYRNGVLACETETCRHAGIGSFKDRKDIRTLHMREEVSWLLPGLRRFITAPGRAELRLAEQLTQLGLDVALWPAFDRYDLRITFRDGEAWAVDVKDWADPILLSHRIDALGPVPIPTDPPWTRAYFVFPEHRRKERSDYVRAVAHRCTRTTASIYFAFEREFVMDVRAKLKEG